MVTIWLILGFIIHYSLFTKPAQSSHLHWMWLSHIYIPPYQSHIGKERFSCLSTFLIQEIKLFSFLNCSWYWKKMFSSIWMSIVWVSTFSACFEDLDMNCFKTLLRFQGSENCKFNNCPTQHAPEPQRISTRYVNLMRT